ncbi:MAG: sensor histidine kinase, partial [Kiritimatiellae bacterium]|nr:sensor histidine kinase [Kiritimatiellia bacterium]
MHASLSDIVADVAANSIEARASRVEVSVVEENGVITLSVKDNGKGMDEATKARAFNPFYT